MNAILYLQICVIRTLVMDKERVHNQVHNSLVLAMMGMTESVAIQVTPNAKNRPMNILDRVIDYYSSIN